MREKIKKLISKIRKKDNKLVKIESYIKEGRVPWSEGYVEYKFQELFNVINTPSELKKISDMELPINYGFGLDERIVEIPWVIGRLSDKKGNLLDAGSSLNFIEILNSQKLKCKDITIFTFDPENNNYNNKRISYVYSDLRDLPFKDKLFDEIACISTIEHIDMDNSIYGWNENNSLINDQIKSYEYLKVIDELSRVLKNSGKLFLTFPYGKFENHGFFQQFDKEMLDRIIFALKGKGTLELDFFKYEKEGWFSAEINDLDNVFSYNPHTGKGKHDDGAAHCRSVCCIEFKKF